MEEKEKENELTIPQIDNEPPRFPPREERERPLILCADDDPDILNILGRFFEGKECDVISVSNGSDALYQTLVENPDLLILDVMMPELNGWQICKYLKTHKDATDAAIIMLTAIGPVNNMLTSPLFGADDYIDKPFEFEELSFKIRKVLSAKHKDKYPLFENDDL